MPENSLLGRLKTPSESIGIVPSDTEHTWGVDLRRRRTANGGWEWFLQLNRTPLYPSDAQVGVFTEPGVTLDEAFRRVLAAWGVG